MLSLSPLSISALSHLSSHYTSRSLTIDSPLTHWWIANLSVNSHLSRLSRQIPIPFTESQIPIPNCRIKARWILKSVKHYTNWSSLSVTNRSALSFPLPPTETQTGTDSILKIVFLVWSSADLFINLCL
jgi:hypothetical protein